MNIYKVYFFKGKPSSMPSLFFSCGDDVCTSKITFLKLGDIFCNEAGKAPTEFFPFTSHSVAIHDAESLWYPLPLPHLTANNSILGTKFVQRKFSLTGRKPC